MADLIVIHLYRLGKYFIDNIRKYFKNYKNRIYSSLSCTVFLD